MSIINTLIIDRTEADYNRAVELSAKGLSGMTAAEAAEYLAGLKGAYNAADLNRVQGAMEYIADRMTRAGYSVTLRGGPVWTMSDIPDPEQLTVYLGDLSALRAVLNVHPTTPSVPADMEDFTWQEANDIEKILLDIEEVLTQMAKCVLRCGHAGVYSGARGLPAEGYITALTWAELDAQKLNWADWDEKTWFTLLYGR